MLKKFLASILGIIFCSTSYLAIANDDDVEMQTDIKPGANPSLPVGEQAKPAPPAKPPSPADFALRTKIRKRAPFWIDDSDHGAAIRINKDGTFSSEAQGGGSIAGSWKAMNNQLYLQWSDGGEKYSYPVSAGKDLTIRGKKAIKNRYKIQ